ncbi:MAG: preprotein translocase subunit YajC [Eubacteriales bacterium]|nr:preprotein translocase subunit YajC [Eubacteriales bacterium]MDD3349493.1 preprotein translocase subunit YajC [Eubacteriales bacterium]
MEQLMSLAPLILLIVIMYFLLIRPQKKRDKQINTMRSAIKAGDQIITIGGIYGTVVKAKDEQLVIQVGADKTKIEVARWAVSKVLNEEPVAARTKKTATEEDTEQEVKKIKPKKLEKSVSTATVSTEAIEETPSEDSSAEAVVEVTEEKTAE